MKKSAVRLAGFAVLFASWIGYLAYLAATTTQPIVLSRPQFLSADLYVVAELSADAAGNPNPVVTVKQIAWSANADDKKRTQLEIKNLSAADGKHGWQGPGQYVLALSRSGSGPDVFELTPLPRTPGFVGESGRVYPATSTTLRQLELLTREYHP